MNDIYGIKDILEFLSYWFFLSLLSLILIIVIYILLSKFHKNKTIDSKLINNDDEKNIDYNFLEDLDILYSNINSLNEVLFLKKLLHIYILFINNKYNYDFSSKTLLEFKNLDIIEKKDLDLYSNIYNNIYSYKSLDKNYLNDIFYKVRQQVTDN